MANQVITTDTPLYDVVAVLMLEARLELLEIGRLPSGVCRGIVAMAAWSAIRCVRPKLRGRDMDLLAADVCGLALRRYTLKSGGGGAGCLALRDGPLCWLYDR